MREIKTTWKHIRRSPYQSMAAILTMFLTFLLTGIFSLVCITSIIVLQYFESKPQLTVFFTDKATDTDIKSLQSTLEGTGKIASLKFVSKQDALAIYKEQNKNDPLLLEMVTADILPASLEISTTKPRFLKEIEPIVKSANEIEEVVYQRDVVETLLAWTNAMRVIGSILVGLLGFDALLITMTVINMKIALKKEEVEVLKLVGATSWYIRVPFVLEGGIYGLIGAFFSWCVIIGFVLWLRPFFLNFLGVIPTIHTYLANPISMVFMLPVVVYLGILLLAGFLLGSVGSLIALARYLNF